MGSRYSRGRQRFSFAAPYNRVAFAVDKVAEVVVEVAGIAVAEWMNIVAGILVEKILVAG